VWLPLYGIQGWFPDYIMSCPTNKSYSECNAGVGNHYLIKQKTMEEDLIKPKLTELATNKRFTSYIQTVHEMKRLLIILLLALGVGNVKAQEHFIENNDYRDILSISLEDKIWRTGEILTSPVSKQVLIFKCSEVFYIKLDNTYYRFGIEKWEYLNLIIKDLKDGRNKKIKYNTQYLY